MPPVPKKPVYVYGPRDDIPSDVTLVDTTSHSKNWSRDLSPFYLGPVQLYGGHISQTVENGWQYAKVYQCHYEEVQGMNGNINKEYWEWAKEGWNNPRAVRYPMGKGARPLFSLWNGNRLTYIEARKNIYIPLYSRAVVHTEAYKKLVEMYQTERKLGLWDFDGYDYLSIRHTLTDVLNNQNRKMGHAFVLAMLLHGIV